MAAFWSGLTKVRSSIALDTNGVEPSASHGYARPMTAPDDVFSFLPGVRAAYVLERLAKADGREVSSGKLASEESSAALAVNTFGWFHDRPERLPPFSMFGPMTSRPTLVEVEYCARLPWSGGRHPWLDAWAEAPEVIIGIESKRFEP